MNSWTPSPREGWTLTAQPKRYWAHEEKAVKDGRAFRVVISTAGTEEEGARIAKSLLERKLCACVNLVPKVRSFYRWEGAIQDDAEVLLIMKTTKEKLQRLSEHLAEIHSYDVPEVLAVAVDQGRASYLEWLEESCAD